MGKVRWDARDPLVGGHEQGGRDPGPERHGRIYFWTEPLLVFWSTDKEVCSVSESILARYRSGRAQFGQCIVVPFRSIMCPFRSVKAMTTPYFSIAQEHFQPEKALRVTPFVRDIKDLATVDLKGMVHFLYVHYRRRPMRVTSLVVGCINTAIAAMLKQTNHRSNTTSIERCMSLSIAHCFFVFFSLYVHKYHTSSCFMKPFVMTSLNNHED